MLIVNPVIVEPLTREWEEAKDKIAKAIERYQTHKDQGQRTRAYNEAVSIHHAFVEKLKNFRVLDPACGSGNFLYLSLLKLKDIEHHANLDAEALGLPRMLPSVGPECVKGIEINPFAAELARVSVWIGEIQWMRKNGFGVSTQPVLKSLDTIERRDALLDDDGKEAKWPDADIIIGNPPFLGGKMLISYLGENYIKRLFEIFSPAVPRESDLVCYWFQRPRKLYRRNKRSVLALCPQTLFAAEPIKRSSKQSALSPRFMMSGTMNRGFLMEPPFVFP